MILTAEQLEALAAAAIQVASLSDDFDGLYIRSFSVGLADFPCDIDLRFDSQADEFVLDIGQFQ